MHLQTARWPRQRGLTLVELAIVGALAALLAAVAIPNLTAYFERGRVAQARVDIAFIEAKVVRFRNDAGRMPATLAEAGVGNLADPWRRPYRYLDLTNPANRNDARKDRNLHPINSDFDLYSMGADGRSVKPLTGGPSQDDIIRARDGAFVGLVRDYYH